METAVTLKRVERQRLERLAREAGCSTGLRDVLRDGFDYTEYRIRALNDGLLDLQQERLLTLDELKARMQRRRADRAARIAKPLSFTPLFERDLQRVEAWYLQGCG